MLRVPHPRGSAAWALTLLLVTGIILNAAVLVSASNEVNRTRGDFCGWAQVHYRAALSLPRTPARTADAQADEQLARSLGCPP